MPSIFKFNPRDYTTWAGVFGFVSTVAFAIPHPAAQTVGTLSAGVASAILAAFTSAK